MIVSKFKKCRICKDKFEVELPKQIVCSPSCALAYNFVQQDKAKAKKEKAFRAETKRLKDDMNSNSRSHQLKLCQKAFNKYIRLRDSGNPCISCDAPPGGGGYIGSGAVHASHYKSVGAHPELRFEELNCHNSCARCNETLSGNIVNYRPRLIDKIGIEKVEWLEGPHPIVKLSIEDIKDIKAKYTELSKQIERDQQSTLRI